jgi:hypothetical protein
LTSPTPGELDEVAERLQRFISHGGLDQLDLDERWLILAP